MFLIPWSNLEYKNIHQANKIMKTWLWTIWWKSEMTVVEGTRHHKWIFLFLNVCLASVQRTNLSSYHAACFDPPRWSPSSRWRRPPAHPCVAAGRVRAWLAWLPGLDVQHLSADSFFRGCEVTPRHICRGAGDPCNQPPEGPPQPHRPSPAGCVIPTTHSPPPHHLHLLSSAASSQKWHPDFFPRCCTLKAADA